MKLEFKLFLYGVLFFFPIGLIYGVWSHGEPVGTVGIPLIGGLVGMIGAYLALLSRRIDPRPEDDEHGERPGAVQPVELVAARGRRLGCARVPGSGRRVLAHGHRRRARRHRPRGLGLRVQPRDPRALIPMSSTTAPPE
jgi:hypothetical protein